MVDPHGGVLVDLLVSAERRAELRKAVLDWRWSWSLDDCAACDLEMLVTGGFSPLRGFMDRADYDSVLSRMRLADGTLWPVPVTLGVPSAFAEPLSRGDPLALQDEQGNIVALLHVSDVWEPDLEAETQALLASRSEGASADVAEHPWARRLASAGPTAYVGGRVEGLGPQVHYDYQELRRPPAELRSLFSRNGWDRIVGFQTRNPMHRVHVEIARRAAAETGAKLLVHPTVGVAPPGDIDHFTRVRCYRAAMSAYAPGSALLSLLPLAMRMAGPREAVWHAIVRKNYGCTHFVVGRDHAGPGRDSAGVPFYEPYEALEAVREHEAELGIGLCASEEMAYVPSRGKAMAVADVPAGEPTEELSGSELRRRLRAGEALPEWFTLPEVEAELRRAFPSRRERGFTVFFTGLSGAGKSTIAGALMVKLLEIAERPVTLLDGDVMRKHLSSELGFSRAHRDLNIRRTAFVAGEITKNGGAALCAPIAPYDAARKEARRIVEAAGGFFLVHVSTPLAVCEQRDRKGLYARARARVIEEFTGVSDPYEAPEDADLAIDGTHVTPAAAAEQILDHLRQEGYLGGELP